MRNLVLLATLALVPVLGGCIPLLVGGAATTGVLVAADRRSVGSVTEDQEIELKVAERVRDSYQDRIHINATSYNRIVLLTGEVPSAAIKAEIEKTVASINNVRGVHNEIAVSETTSTLSNRAHDSFVTSKVKARFVDAAKFQPNHVKVVTERGVVYLLGLVTREEAEQAVEIARTTSDVKRVVKLFQYIQ
ncbi:MAG: BON domain-containing protein [Burkholderiales bacterium]|nr:BON domain-containing protein [Burkholderiales bacterium]